MPRSRRAVDRLAEPPTKPRRTQTPAWDREAQAERIRRHAERVAREEGPAPPPAQDADGQMLLFGSG